MKSIFIIELPWFQRCCEDLRCGRTFPTTKLVSSGVQGAAWVVALPWFVSPVLLYFGGGLVIIFVSDEVFFFVLFSIVFGSFSIKICPACFY